MISWISRACKSHPSFFELGLRLELAQHHVPNIKLNRKKLRRAAGAGMVVFSIITMSMTPFADRTAFSAPEGSYTATGGRNADDTRVWNYTISEVGNAKDISHISIKTCFTTEELNGGVLIDTDPEDASVGYDGSTGFNNVIKWDRNFEAPATVSITLDQAYGIDPTGTTVIIKYGPTYVAVAVPGPSCGQAPPPPPPPPPTGAVIT